MTPDPTPFRQRIHRSDLPWSTRTRIHEATAQYFAPPVPGTDEEAAKQALRLHLVGAAMFSVTNSAKPETDRSDTPLLTRLLVAAL